MDTEQIKSALKSNVYFIEKDKKVALHKHLKYNEVFYCLKGEGFGVLEGGEQKLNAGEVFIVKENTMHSLRSDSEMTVASFLIPVLEI
jgi:quercetin dioxygenase-like cupin family protein